MFGQNATAANVGAYSPFRHGIIVLGRLGYGNSRVRPRMAQIVMAIPLWAAMAVAPPNPARLRPAGRTGRRRFRLCRHRPGRYQPCGRAPTMPKTPSLDQLLSRHIILTGRRIRIRVHGLPTQVVSEDQVEVVTAVRTREFPLDNMHQPGLRNQHPGFRAMTVSAIRATALVQFVRDSLVGHRPIFVEVGEF